MQHSNDIIQLETLDNICHRCKLRSLCSVDTLSASERKKFSDVTIHDEKWDRGQHLFFPGDRLRFIYIVHSGSFKIYITNTKGDAQITGFYFQGDVLNLHISDHAVQNYGAIALETATVCKIPLAEFEKMVSQYPALSNAFLKIMSREITQKQRMILALSKMTAEQKVADFLIHMSTESKSRGYSSAVLSLSMLRLDIANYLGLAIETVSRTFKNFQNKGIISVERNKISIEDFEALKSYLPYDDASTSIKTVTVSQK
ncbi:MAG: helix-turn-helix domain-containing protein [Gammaproteobacteria bacterium]|nr:helix-turn-helix domain-containing protein [Gammaproteobacteria bacterium]